MELEVGKARKAGPWIEHWALALLYGRHTSFGGYRPFPPLGLVQAVSLGWPKILFL